MFKPFQKKRPQPHAYVISEALGAGETTEDKPDRRIAMSSRTRQAAEEGRKRIAVCGLLFVIAFSIVGGRLAMIGLTGAPEEKANRLADAEAPLRPEIHDRTGAMLAANVPVYTIEANGKKVWDADETAGALAALFPAIDPADLAQKLKAGRNVPVARNVGPDMKDRVFALGLPGVTHVESIRRIYPRGALAAHAVGYVNHAAEGKAGLERLLDIDPSIEAGAPLVAALDMRVQQILEEEVARDFDKFGAKAGWGLVMNVRTGEVLALVSLPGFDPNHPGASDDKSVYRNRVTFDVYELGSAFKAFTVAAALEEGAATFDETYDARKPLKLSGHTIRDFHAERRILTVPEIFMHSSNIGSALMALDVGVEGHKAFLEEFGLLSRIDMAFPEKGRPLVPSPWGDIHSATIAFGHGLAVSPLHVASGMAALANGGVYQTPSFLALTEAPGGRRVVSEETSEKILALMRLVVAEGTGSKADVPGYCVGGKTATAEKAAAGGYDRRRLISSFVGVFPGDKPEFLIMTSLDEPNGLKETHGYATAGWTAAPTTGRVIERIGPLLGVLPTACEPKYFAKARAIAEGVATPVTVGVAM